MPKGENLIGKGGVKFGYGQDNTRGGRKKKPKFIDIINEIASGDGYMLFDTFELVKNGEKKQVKVKLPTDTALAIKLWNMANKDVRWFSELAKVRALYAPNKIANTDSNGDDIKRQVIELPNGAKINIS